MKSQTVDRVPFNVPIVMGMGWFSMYKIIATYHQRLESHVYNQILKQVPDWSPDAILIATKEWVISHNHMPALDIGPPAIRPSNQTRVLTDYEGRYYE